MVGVNKDLALVFTEAIKVAPIDFGIPEFGGLRTAEEQFELHRRGSSPNCDGYETLSNHQSGNALDFYAYVDGKASWDKIHLAMVAATIMTTANRLGIELRWGGQFGSAIFHGWDMPHIEVLVQ